MIDWFPLTSSDSPARSLARWHGVVSLRRAARAIDALEPTTQGHSERVADLEESVRASIRRLRATPELPHRDAIRGAIIDLVAGGVRPVDG